MTSEPLPLDDDALEAMRDYAIGVTPDTPAAVQQSHSAAVNQARIMVGWLVREVDRLRTELAETRAKRDEAQRRAADYNEMCCLHATTGVKMGAKLNATERERGALAAKLDAIAQDGQDPLYWFNVANDMERHALRARDALADVRELHQLHRNAFGQDECKGCSTKAISIAWPCDTYRIAAPETTRAPAEAAPAAPDALAHARAEGIREAAQLLESALKDLNDERTSE